MTLMGRGIKALVKELQVEMNKMKSELDKLREENQQLQHLIKDLDITKQHMTPIVILDRESNQASDGPGIEFVTAAEFTMTGYSKYKRENKIWRSPAFYNTQKGYRMCLEVFANGKKEVIGQYISINVYFMRGEFDREIPWPFRGELIIELVSHRKEVTSVRHAIRYTETTPRELSDKVVTGGDCAAVGKGVLKFIHLSELPTTFLENDCLRFKILRYKVSAFNATGRHGLLK
jgi:hypothetical protein